ncbi:hypothetical protein GIB67_022315, partial [Kingdonia uniflora]
MATCYAILDLSTTLVARQSFCRVSAVDKLMSVFLQEAVSPAKYISLSNTYYGVGITEAEYPVLLLEATVTLINTCNMKQLATIPSKLFLSYLKELWVNVRDQSLLRNPADLSNDRNCNYKNMRKHELEENIFRLSTTYDAFTITCKSELVKKNIFGPNELDFENFILREVHFFNAFENFCCKNAYDIINVSDVKKCIEAFQEGYTIALHYAR